MHTDTLTLTIPTRDFGDIEATVRVAHLPAEPGFASRVEFVEVDAIEDADDDIDANLVAIHAEIADYCDTQAGHESLCEAWRRRESDLEFAAAERRAESWRLR